MYGFIRSPVDERGRSWRKTSRSANRGSSFSIPRIDTSTGGSVVHMRPLPSDSTTQIVPVSATPKLAPLTPTCASRNRSRRYRRGGLGEVGRLVRRDSRRDRAREEVADLAPVAVDRRDEDVRRPVAVELEDQLGEVGLERVDAGLGERVVELDLVGRQRLHLHDLVRAVRAGDVERRPRSPRLASRAQWTWPPGRLDRLLELDQVLVEVREHVVLDRPAGLAQLLPVGQLRDDARALGADRLGRVAQVRPQLGVRERDAARPPGKLWSSSTRGSPRGGRCARSRRGGTARRRSAAGTSRRPRCRRRRPSPRSRALVGEHRARRLGVLDRERAAEAAALVRAAAARRARGRGRSAAAASGASPTRVTRSEWQVGW